MPAGPVSGENQAQVWTGRLVLRFNPLAQSSGPTGTMNPGDLAATDPTTQNWTSLPRAPKTAEDAQMVWVGDRLIIWGTLPTSGKQSGPAAGSGIELDPASAKTGPTGVVGTACTSSQVHATLEAGLGAMGESGLTVIFRDVSAAPCRMPATPSVTVVSSAGTELAPAAQFSEPGPPGRPGAMRPGATTVAGLMWPSDRRGCSTAASLASGDRLLTPTTLVVRWQGGSATVDVPAGTFPSPACRFNVISFRIPG